VGVNVSTLKSPPKRLLRADSLSVIKGHTQHGRYALIGYLKREFIIGKDRFFKGLSVKSIT
jgi:hypothetical protein